MSIPILAVDKNLEVYGREQASWKERSVGIVRVDTMREGIEEVLRSAYRFVAINADNIPYLPLLPTMREATAAPIFIITSNFSIQEQVKALHAGADVYAPFQDSVEENILSALAQLHRYSEQRKTSEKPVVCQNLIIDPNRRQAFIGNHLLDLTPLEYEILLHLARNRGRALSKGAIYCNAWQEDNCLDVDSALSYHIHNIRQKLAEHTKEVYIETVWGYGFRMNDTPK